MYLVPTDVADVELLKKAVTDWIEREDHFDEFHRAMAKWTAHANSITFKEPNGRCLDLEERTVCGFFVVTGFV